MCVSGFRILTNIIHNEIWYFSDANYSIKYNTNILLYNILQIDVCLRIQNLKKNWKLVSKQSPPQELEGGARSAPNF